MTGQIEGLRAGHALSLVVSARWRWPGLVAHRVAELQDVVLRDDPVGEGFRRRLGDAIWTAEAVGLDAGRRAAVEVMGWLEAGREGARDGRDLQRR